MGCQHSTAAASSSGSGPNEMGVVYSDPHDPSEAGMADGHGGPDLGASFAAASSTETRTHNFPGDSGPTPNGTEISVSSEQSSAPKKPAHALTSAASAGNVIQVSPRIRLPSPQLGAGEVAVSGSVSGKPSSQGNLYPNTNNTSNSVTISVHCVESDEPGNAGHRPPLSVTPVAEDVDYPERDAEPSKGTGSPSRRTRRRSTHGSSNSANTTANVKAAAGMNGPPPGIGSGVDTSSLPAGIAMMPPGISAPSSRGRVPAVPGLMVMMDGDPTSVGASGRPHGYSGARKRSVSVQERRKSTVVTTTFKKDYDDEGNKRVNAYSIIRNLGKGAYGKVKLVSRTQEDDGSERLFAIKIIKKSLLRKMNRGPGGMSALMNIQREIAIMKKLKEEYCVKLLEVIDDEQHDKMYMILEYMENGPLMQVNDDGTADRTPYDEERARELFRQILDGMEYLHSQGIMHRDIKPENILLDHKNQVRISDYGVSLSLNGGEDRIHSTAGTPAFMAPEVLQKGTYSGKKSDVWSLGVTLYVMLFGRVPFMSKTYMEMREKIMTSKISLPRGISKELRDLFIRVFDRDVEKRLSIREFREHPWVTGGKLEVRQEHAKMNISSDDINAAITKGDGDKTGTQLVVRSYVQQAVSGIMNHARKQLQSRKEWNEIVKDRRKKRMNAVYEVVDGSDSDREQREALGRGSPLSGTSAEIFSENGGPSHSQGHENYHQHQHHAGDEDDDEHLSPSEAALRVLQMCIPRSAIGSPEPDA